MRSTRKSAAFALAAAAALTLAACGGSGGAGSGGSSNSSGPVTLTWWENGTTAPLRPVWQQVANAFHAANPKVTIKLVPIQNEQFTTKVPLALQGNNPPSLFQQWGGGQEATQIKSGKLLDVTSTLAPTIKQLGPSATGWQVNGRQYGMPYDLHMVGFWYRKDLFAKAHITSPPATLSDLNADVTKLKQAHIVPIAIGSKDRWPDAFYWDYFAIRDCSTTTLKASMKAIKLSDPCFVKAGTDLKAFMNTHPFQAGFLGTPAQQGAGSSAGMVANGKAAMELQGDWDVSTMIPLTNDKKIVSKLGWFPFPSVPGGAGDPGVIMGGGDGFSCTTTAPEPACTNFLKYIDSTAVQKKLVTQAQVGLPANPAASSVLANPQLKQILAASQSASYVQTYFDIALPTNVGQALDTAVADFFAGKATPQSVVQQINQAAATP